MGIIGAKKTRKARGEAPGTPQARNNMPLAMNSHADARAEAEMRAQGLVLEAPPSESCQVSLELQVQRLVEADASLFHSPLRRKLVMDMMTRPLTNMDGSPVTDKSGKTITVTKWDALINAEVGRAVNGDPKAGTSGLWLTLFGKPREAMEFSGPAGGPIETHSRNENLNLNLSAEEVQANLREMAETIRLARAARDGVIEVPTAIDVKAELIAESQADAEAGIIPIAGKAS